MVAVLSQDDLDTLDDLFEWASYGVGEHVGWGGVTSESEKEVVADIERLRALFGIVKPEPAPIPPHDYTKTDLITRAFSKNS